MNTYFSNKLQRITQFCFPKGQQKKNFNEPSLTNEGKIRNKSKHTKQIKEKRYNSHQHSNTHGQ